MGHWQEHCLPAAPSIGDIDLWQSPDCDLGLTPVCFARCATIPHAPHERRTSAWTRPLGCETCGGRAVCNTATDSYRLESTGPATPVLGRGLSLIQVASAAAGDQIRPYCVQLLYPFQMRNHPTNPCRNLPRVRRLGLASNLGDVRGT